jgi:hypothetical protein
VGPRFVVQENDAFSEHPAPSLNFLHHSHTQLSLTTRLRWNSRGSSISTVAPVGSSVGALYQKLYIQSHVILRMGEFVARNMQGWFKKLNKGKSRCILLVAYIVVLVMHGHTNFKLPVFYLPTYRGLHTVVVYNHRSAARCFSVVILFSVRKILLTVGV